MGELHPNKKLIFDAIEALIVEQGIEAVTFSELARRCYLQPSGVIYYFKSKNNMLREFFAYILQRVRDTDTLDGAEAAEIENPAEAFCRFVDTVLFSQSYNEPLSAALLRSTFSAPLSDRSTRDLMASSLLYSIQSVMQKVLWFRETGIVEESRFGQSLSCFIYAVIGYQYTGYIGCAPPAELQSLLSPHLAAEHIKRSFLKDGLYPLSGKTPQDSASTP